MISLVLLCCACTLWFVRKWRLERMAASVPTLPGELPFIGHAHHLIGNSEGLWEYLQSIQTYTINRGGIIKAWLGPKLCFAVTDPKIAKKMLHTFEDKPYIYEFGKSWIDTGLVTSDVSTWRRHRKLLNPTFSQRVLDGFLDVFNVLSAKFVTKIEKELNKDEFDIFPYINDLTMENIFQTAFGLKTLQKCSNEYKEAAAKLNDIFCIRFQSIWMHPSFIYNWTKTKKKEEIFVKVMKKTASEVYRTKKFELNENLNKETKKSGRSLKGFLDCLLELQSDGLLMDKEVTEEVDTMIAAGTDTISRTLLFTLILLASHSDAQDRVQTELQEVLAESSCNVNKSNLSKFVYLEAVIKESLRLYTIVPVIARIVTQDYKQDDFVVPSGSLIMVMLSGINRNDSWGQDVETFNPDRWFDGSLPDFASFSFGARACLGRNYAMMLMKTTLAHFLHRYRVSRRDTQIKLDVDIMLKPMMAQKISIELRQ